MQGKAVFHFEGPAEHLEQLRDRAQRRRVPLAVVLREAVELALDADEHDVVEYFGPRAGARRVRVEIAGGPIGNRGGRE